MEDQTHGIRRIHAYLPAIAFVLAVVAIVSYAMISSAPASLTGAVGAKASRTGSSESSLGLESASQEPFSADEIYKLFVCSCCGRTIDARCCGMARDMINYVDYQISAGLSKTDVILQTAKKYGLDSLVESMQDEVREELMLRAPDERPKIGVEPGIFDFGDVSQASGDVSTFFTVSNDGDSVLTIEGIETSCGCTSASLEGSPFFGMAGHAGHGASPPGWSHDIPPGGTATLEVKYDPNMHKDLRGPVTRSVHLTSNDPIDFRKEVRIELNQVS